MKLEDLSKMNELHEKLSSLRGKYHEVNNANMIALVHQVPKYKGSTNHTEDAFIIITVDDIPIEEQRLILKGLKEAALNKLRKKISEIEGKILDL